MAADAIPPGNWLMDDDVNLFDSLACLLEDDADDCNDSISDLETTSAPARGSTGIKQEKGGKGMKKRKFNPDSDVIAAATDETLKTLELDPNSKEGKQKRRQIRNRLSAQFHRDRKNAHINTLEDEMSKKDQEIAALKEQVASLIAENDYLKKMSPGTAFGTHQRRDHTVSLGSYPDNSTLNTDSEDGENSVQSMLFYLNGGAANTGVPMGGVNGQFSSAVSTYSGTSLTASPHSSPFRCDLETALPGIVLNHVGQITPPPRGVAAGTHQIGQSLLNIPSNLARPLSLITMVCMVSLMLLSTQQGPSMNMMSYQPSAQTNFGQYQLGQGQGEAALKVGSELLALMHTTGARVVETRQHTAHSEEALHHQHHHQRRLSSDNSHSDSDESSVNSADSSTPQGYAHHSSVIAAANVSLGTQFTPEEVSAAAKGIASLNLESPQSLLYSLQHLIDSPAVGNHEANVTGARRHNNLRRSHADMQEEASAAGANVNVNGTGFPTTKQSKRQVIYSSGVVSRGLVEDAYLYPPHYMSSSLVPHSGRLSQSTDSHHNHDHGEENEQFAHSGEYHWPASQAFDYAVQSYSKVVLTQGQALLDPSLSLNKNPFAWTRSMFNQGTHGAAESEAGGDVDVDTEEAASVPMGGLKATRTAREPTITESEAEEDAEMETEAMDLAEESPPAVVTLPVVQKAKVPTGKALNGDATNAVVPVFGANAVHTTTTAHALAGPFHNVFDNEAFEEVPSEASVMHKLLAESNFMTLKLPASSIRVGKTWGESKDGTVESLMDVFNISKGDEDAGHYGTEASVEINCIILGAKLVVTQPASV